MKKILLLLLSIVFVSCTTPKILLIQDAEYETKLRSYNVSLISKSFDSFRVYKLNDTDYAVVPFKNIFTEAGVDDLAKSIIFTAEEANEFKENLKEFVEECQKNKNGIFFAEIKVKESVTKITTSVETTATKSKTVSSGSLENSAFIIQAVANNKKIQFSAYSKYSYSPFSITLDDIKNLIIALDR